MSIIANRITAGSDIVASRAVDDGNSDSDSNSQSVAEEGAIVVASQNSNLELNHRAVDNYPRYRRNLNLTYPPRISSHPLAMATQQIGNGWNPQFGPDNNPHARRPVYNAVGSGFAVPGSAGPGYVMNPAPQFPGMAPASVLPGPNNVAPTYVIPQNGQNHPVPVFPNQELRLPNPHPVVSLDTPALNLSNSTGGVGCEPGYNYFFPPEHTKLHVIKSTTAPWRLPEGMSMGFGAYHVPVSTTLSELMAGFGAVNPIPRKNRITEVIQGGNGKWYRGITFAGNDGSVMNKTLRALGWDRTRTGRPGEKPVIWLWITKD